MSVFSLNKKEFIKFLKRENFSEDYIVGNIFELAVRYGFEVKENMENEYVFIIREY